MRDRGWGTRLSIGFITVAATLTAGCPGREARFDSSIGLIGPSVGDGRAVYLSGAREAALILDPEVGSFEVVRLSGAPLSGRPVPTTTDFAVLVPGAERLDVVGVLSGALRSYDLGSGFDALSLSDDGGYALASFAGGAAGGLSNAAEVAVVDLGQAPSDQNPTVRTVSSAGGTPLGIDLSPAFGPAAQRLAFVRSTNHLAAIDLTQPTGATRSIPLVSPGSTTTVVPEQILFAAAGARLDVFVRVSGLDDVYHLRFDGSADADGAPLPVLNQFATGINPRDMAVWTDAEDRLQLLTVNRGSKDLTIVDVESAQSQTIALGAPADRVLLYTGASGDPEALIYPTDGATQQFHRVALADLAVKKSKALSTHSLAAPIGALQPAMGGAWFVVTHPNATPGSTAVTLVEAAGSALLPFTGTGPIIGHALSEDGARIFLLSSAYGSPAQLSVIDVATGHPETRNLDGISPTGLTRISGTRWLLVSEGHMAGGLTLVDGDALEDAELRSLRGFGLTGILDEEGEAE